MGRPPGAAAGRLADPRARPSKFRSRSQPCPHRILFDVLENALKFRSVANHVIVTLPERPSGQAEDLVGSLGGNAFQRGQSLGHCHVRGQQHVNMIGHHDEGVQVVMTKSVLAIPQRIDDHVGDCAGSPVHRAGAGLVEQAIQSHEGLPGRQLRSGTEGTMRRQAPFQPPSQEQRPLKRVIMRETPPIGPHSE